MAQPSLSEQVRRLEAELGVRLFQRGGRGLVPTEAGRHAARARRARARRRRGRARARSPRSASCAGGTATFGTWGAARFYPGDADRRGLPPELPEGARAAARPELRRRRRGGARRRARGRDGRAARSTTAGSTSARSCSDELVYASADPARPAGADDDPRDRRRAADPGRRLLRDGGPDAPPARGARAGRGGHDRAGDRRRGRRDGDRAGRAGLGDTIVARGIIHSHGRRCPSGSAGSRSPSRCTTRSPSSSAATRASRPRRREFLAVAEARLRALAEELEEKPPRFRLPEGAT